MQARRGHGCERTKPRKQSLQRSFVHVRRYAADPHDASLDRLVLLLSRDAHSFLAQRLADGVLRLDPTIAVRLGILRTRSLNSGIGRGTGRGTGGSTGRCSTGCTTERAANYITERFAD